MSLPLVASNQGYDHLYDIFSVPYPSPTLPNDILSRYELHYTATFGPMFLPRFEMIQNFHSRVLGVIWYAAHSPSARLPLHPPFCNVAEQREALTVVRECSDHLYFDRLFPKLERGRRVELCEALLFEARSRKWERETPQHYQRLDLDGEIRKLELAQRASGCERPASDTSAPSVRFSIDSLAPRGTHLAHADAGSRYSVSVSSSRLGVEISRKASIGAAPGPKSSVTRDDILPWEKFERLAPANQPLGAPSPPSRPQRPTLESLSRVGAAGSLRNMESGGLPRGRPAEATRKSAGETRKAPPPAPARDRTTY